MVALSAPVDSVPVVALTPLQPAEAVHDVAFVVLQVNVALAPLAPLVGDAVKVRVGDAGGGVTTGGVFDDASWTLPPQAASMTPA